MGEGFRRFRIALPFILIVMILMRLIWMQLRSYPVYLEGRAVHALAFLQAEVDPTCSYDPSLPRSFTAEDEPLKRASNAWLMSPGYTAFGYAGCLTGVLEDRPIVRLNQWLFAGAVLLAVLTARFTTSSWTMATIIGAMLMSRGRLLADIGQVSIDFPAMLLVTTWLAAQTHFLRTGAFISLGAAVFAALLGALVDRSLAGLALATPIMLGLGYLYRRRLARPVLQRLRGAQRRLDQLALVTLPRRDGEVTTTVGRAVSAARWLLGMEFVPDEAAPSKPTEEQGDLFRPLTTPFLLWVYGKRRWLRISVGWLAVFAVSGVASAVIYSILGGPNAWSTLAAATPKALATLSTLTESWRLGLLDRFDLHLTLSVFVICYCAAQSPAAGLTGFLEATWMLLLAVMLVGGFGFVLDAYDLAMAAHLSDGSLGGPLLLRPVALWFEPAVLTLGAAGVYNLMKVLDTRIAKKP